MMIKFQKINTDADNENLQTLAILSVKLVISNMDVGNGQHVTSRDTSQSCQHCNSVCWQRLLQQSSRRVIKFSGLIQSLQCSMTHWHIKTTNTTTNTSPIFSYHLTSLFSMLTRGQQLSWVRFNVTPNTLIGHIDDGLLWIKWLNQQCQSTKGRS